MGYREPDYAPWDGRRVPLTFVAGYLGAGKTTLINRVLADTDRPIAVFVNDVGEVNVDARLIARQSGDTIELFDGCVCCSLVDGFGAAFNELRARPEPPDHLIVELSGVADPGRVIPWGKTAGFSLDGVITLVGADQFMDLVERPDIGDMIKAQVATADMVAITKLDTAEADSPDVLRAAIGAHAQGATIIDAGDGSLTSTLLRIGGRRPGGPADVPDSTLFDQHVVDRIAIEQPISIAEVNELLDGLDHSVMRAKAIVCDPEGQQWAVHVVGRRRSITPLPDVERGSATDLVTISIA